LTETGGALFAAPRQAGRAHLGVVGAIGIVFACYAATLIAIALWPSESRLLWPVAALAAWCLPAPSGYRGRKRETLRAGASPSVATSS
jgi:hypothetical protein